MEKMYFNGAITQNQLIIGIICVIGLFIVLAVAKKIVRIVCSIVALVMLCINVGVFSPDKVDINNIKGQQTQLVQIAKSSKDYVKVDTKNGVKVQVKINDTWTPLEDIASFKDTDEGYSVCVNGETYLVTDESVQKVLSLVKK